MQSQLICYEQSVGNVKWLVNEFVPESSDSNITKEKCWVKKIQVVQQPIDYLQIHVFVSNLRHTTMYWLFKKLS